MHSLKQFGLLFSFHLHQQFLFVCFVFFSVLLDSSTPKRNEILTILKIKNVLQDEIKKRKSVEKQLQRAQDKLSNANINTEDSIR